MVDAEDCSHCDGYFFVLFSFLSLTSPTGINLSLSLLKLRLIFYIDGVAKTELLSKQVTWETLEFDVAPGYHDFTWTFVKDDAVAKGADQVSVKVPSDLPFLPRHILLWLKNFPFL